MHTMYTKCYCGNTFNREISILPQLSEKKHIAQNHIRFENARESREMKRSHKHTKYWKKSSNLYSNGDNDCLRLEICESWIRRTFSKNCI